MKKILSLFFMSFFMSNLAFAVSLEVPDIIITLEKGNELTNLTNARVNASVTISGVNGGLYERFKKQPVVERISENQFKINEDYFSHNNVFDYLMLKNISLAFDISINGRTVYEIRTEDFKRHKVENWHESLSLFEKPIFLTTLPAVDTLVIKPFINTLGESFSFKKTRGYFDRLFFSAEICRRFDVPVFHLSPYVEPQAYHYNNCQKASVDLEEEVGVSAKEVSVVTFEKINEINISIGASLSTSMGYTDGKSLEVTFKDLDNIDLGELNDSELYFSY